MHVAWLSNAPWSGSGYGVQTALMTERIVRAGHKVTVLTNFGLQGAPLNAGTMDILPSAYHNYGDDVLASHYVTLQPDVYWILFDIWAFSRDVLARVPVSAYAPIDHHPVPPAVRDALGVTRHQVAMSRYGEAQMRKAGFAPYFLPHVVDTNVYRPVDRLAARAKYGLKESTFVAMTIAANKGYPPRKHLDRMIKAWSLWTKAHPDSVWLLHTNPRQIHQGVDIVKVLETYDVDPATVRLPDEYRLAMGMYSGDMLNELLNAADGFWLPSGGEGFGTPVIEAQAAGCPVVVSDYTAQSELAGPGYKIPIDPVDDTLVTLQYAEQAQPKVSEMVKGLAWLYERRGDTGLRAASRDFAMLYDADTVCSKYLMPALEDMARLNAEDKARKTPVRVAARSLEPEAEALCVSA